MNENETVAVNNNQGMDTDIDYISALNEMKQNSVSREMYDKVCADNKKLLNTLVTGGQLSEEIQPVNIDECRQKLFSDNGTISNLEYWDNALKLRQALIDKGERDPFLPYGQNIAPTNEDVATAEKVANVVQECIDYAQGDTTVFTNELQRRTLDTAPMTSRSRRY